MLAQLLTYQPISIHAPRTGSDKSRAEQKRAAQFQSTLPARGATWENREQQLKRNHFNPRSPHGERRRQRVGTGAQSGFQSTLPARGATRVKTFHRVGVEISIHAPRTGSDGRAVRIGADGRDFNPRSPHGERLQLPSKPPFPLRFQSTLPARGATRHRRKQKGLCAFQSTLPARGATKGVINGRAKEKHFNPRSPHGERRRCISA